MQSSPMPPFVRLGPQDEARLAWLRPLLEQHADVLSAAFWRHQLSLRSPSEPLPDAETLERMREEHRAYLLGLAEQGERPAPPAWCAGSFGLHLSLLEPLVREAFAGDHRQVQAILASLEKRLFQDAERALEGHVANVASSPKVPTPQVPAEAPETTRPRPEEAHRILVVDDDHGWVDLLSAMLCGPEFVVCPATDARWAIALAKLYEFDLAIIDWNLDDTISGLELGRRLRALRPEMKCIMISGYPRDAVGEMLYPVFSRFLEKPFDLDVLRTAIGETLAEASG